MSNKRVNTMSRTSNILKPDNIYYSLDDAIVEDIENEYISKLHDIDMMYKANSMTFTGLIKQLHKKLNINRNIYNSIDDCNRLWNIYTDLCYKYNQYPNILEFSLLLGCNRDTIYGWSNGKNGGFSDELSLSRSDTVQNWLNECKQGRYKNASSGNVGGIFLCKAVDGMVETAPVQVKQSSEYKSIEQIANERGIELHENNKQLPPPAPPTN